MTTRKTKKILPLLLMTAVLFLVSCRGILKASGDYKNPKKETPESITSYLKDQGALYDGVFIFRGKTAMKYFLDSVYNSVPAIIVFDKDFKNFITDYKCFSSKPTGLDSLLRTGSWKKNDKLIHQRLLDQLMNIDGSSLTQNSTKEFHVFYTWAKFFPKKSNEMIRENNDLYRNFHDRLYIGAINMDMQESWE